jgi:plastocyanin
MKSALLLAACLTCSPVWDVPASAKTDWSKASKVTVTMVDNAFQPDHVTFQSGQPTELTLVNKGKDMHEFTAPEFLMASTVADKKALSNGGTDIVVQPGTTVQIRLIPGPPGDYKLICADHDWDGMIGSITVAR